MNDNNERQAQKQLTALIRAIGTRTLGEAMVAVRECRFSHKLTGPELNHLLGLLESRQEEGSYSGPREQYYARTERLIKWCHDQIKSTVLRRRRAVMPDYDKKLEEWLS